MVEATVVLPNDVSLVSLNVVPPHYDQPENHKEHSEDVLDD
jgi:hypothetical protein